MVRQVEVVPKAHNTHSLSLHSLWSCGPEDNLRCTDLWGLGASKSWGDVTAVLYYLRQFSPGLCFLRFVLCMHSVSLAIDLM